MFISESVGELSMAMVLGNVDCIISNIFFNCIVINGIIGFFDKMGIISSVA
jgi:hypothetical protein